MHKLKIRELRTQKKLTQKEVSKLTGVSRNYISELENMKHDSTVEILLMLSNGLNVSPMELIGGEELKNFSLDNRKKLKKKIIDLIIKDNPVATREFIKTLLDEIKRDLENIKE